MALLRSVIFCVYLILINYSSIRVFSDVIPNKVTANKEWKLKFTKELDKATVTTDNVYVLDSTGNKVDVTVSYGEDQVLRVTPVNHHKAGQTYYLYINNNVTTKDKAVLTNSLKYEFTVQN